MPDNKMPDQSGIIMTAEGLPIAKNQHAWDMMSDSEKAAILAGWTKTWSQGGSSASTTSPRRPEVPTPELPTVIDFDDHTIRDNWQPNTEQRIGTKENDWK
jgi:hypothetical protein